MGKHLAKIPHEECGSGGGLQVFAKPDGTVDGFCFACGTYVRHPFGEEKLAKELPPPKEKTEEEVIEEMAWIETFPQPTVKDKRIHATALKHFGVRVGVSEQDGVTPRALFYPYTDGSNEVIGWKCKIFPEKKIWSIGRMKNVDFFGWQQALDTGAKKLFITEGEDDAMSVWWTLQRYSGENYKNFSAVVSLPNGVSNATELITERWDVLKENFDEVIACFDTDNAGKREVERVCAAIPGIFSVTTPSKDANQCLLDGRSKALYNALFKAGRPKNTRVLDVADVKEAILTPPKWGELSWPWPKLDDKLRGIRYGETIYIGAGVKMGKSEIVNALGAHFVKNHQVNILMAKPEEANALTGKKLAGKWNGKIYHDPKIDVNMHELADTVDKMAGKVKLLDLYQHLGWETLRDDIREVVVNNGVKAVFIDPITNLTDGLSAADANTKLREITAEASAMASDLDIVVFLFCHLKAHENHLPMDRRDKYYGQQRFIGLGNCAHEMGGTIYSNQFAGSRAMMQKCDLMIGLEGNHDPELPDPNWANIKHLKILENRAFGDRGVFPLYWSPDTQLFTEIEDV